MWVPPSNIHHKNPSIYISIGCVVRFWGRGREGEGGGEREQYSKKSALDSGDPNPTTNACFDRGQRGEGGKTVLKTASGECSHLDGQCCKCPTGREGKEEGKERKGKRRRSREGKGKGA